MKIEHFALFMGGIGVAALLTLTMSYHNYLYKKHELDRQYQEALLENSMQKYCEKERLKGDL